MKQKPPPTSTRELHLALAAVVAACGDSPSGRALCRGLLDGATRLCGEAPETTLAALGIDNGIIGRANAIAALATLCASCGACPRGLAAQFTAEPLAS